MFTAGAGGYALPEPPDDTVSRLRFSPSATTGDHYLVAASWNGTLRCWRAKPTGSDPLSFVKTGAAPILDCIWAQDGQSVIYAGADGSIARWDLKSSQCTPLGSHANNVARSVCNVSQVSMIASGGWDRSVRYWDERTPKQVGSVTTPERVYGMDVRGVLMVVGLASRQVVVYDVRKPEEPFKKRYSNLRYQTRSVATFPDSMGFALGGADGKVSIEHVQDAKSGKDFVFRAHTEKSETSHCVNAMRFHEYSGALATAGADGYVRFWDKERRSPSGSISIPKANAPVTDVDFSHDGTMFAYSVGYDWSQGTFGLSNNFETAVFVQALKEGDLGSSGRGHGGRGGRGRRGRGRGRR